MFTVNGKELDYDIFDVDKAEAFENALNLVAKKMEDLEKDSDGMTYAQVIRVQCEAVADCFDALFGKGTAGEIFGGTMNLKTSMKAFEDLVVGVNKKKAEVEKMAENTRLKFSGNRAQRRAKK